MFMEHKPSHCAPTSALKEVVVTSITTVVSFCEQGREILAFAFANALAKRDMVIGFMSRFAKNANARSSPRLACRRVKLTTVVTLVTTTSFKALVGAQWLGLCPVSLMH